MINTINQITPDEIQDYIVNKVESKKEYPVRRYLVVQPKPRKFKLWYGVTESLITRKEDMGHWRSLQGQSISTDTFSVHIVGCNAKVCKCGWLNKEAETCKWAQKLAVPK